MPSAAAADDDARRALLEALAAVAPEADLARLAPDRPLREQIDLDSLDWVNLLAAVLPDDAAAAGRPPGPQATLADLVRWAARPRDGERPDAGPPQGAGAADATGPAHAIDAAAAAVAGGAGLTPADVTLRPLGAADAPLEAAFVAALSDDSRYKRFMGTLTALSPAKLAELTDVDQVRHVALAAVTRADGGETLVGVARYVVDADDRSAEFAVTVADAWQRTGLAGRLMHALMAHARAQGLACLWGLVLASNRPMLRFVRQLGFRVQAEPGDVHTVRAVRYL